MKIYNGICSYCKKGLWIWQDIDFLEEGYGGGKALCHFLCHFKCHKTKTIKDTKEMLGKKNEK